MHWRDAVDGEEFPSRRKYIIAISTIADHSEMAVWVQVHSHQEPAGVPQVHLIEKHIGKWLWEIGKFDNWL